MRFFLFFFLDFEIFKNNFSCKKSNTEERKEEILVLFFILKHLLLFMLIELLC